MKIATGDGELMAQVYKPNTDRMRGDEKAPYQARRPPRVRQQTVLARDRKSPQTGCLVSAGCSHLLSAIRGSPLMPIPLSMPRAQIVGRFFAQASPSLFLWLRLDKTLAGLETHEVDHLLGDVQDRQVEGRDGLEVLWTGLE